MSTAFRSGAKTVIEAPEEDALKTEVDPVVLHFAPIMKRLSSDDFFKFCARQDWWRLELTKEGDLIIMMPSGSETGRGNASLTRLFGNWAEIDGTGETFGANSGFTLPNGAMRSPDVAWIRKDRWNALTRKQRKKFAPLCPDFVIELRSPTDRLPPLQVKMEEYIENGAQLGWLIDPLKRKVYIYRPQSPVECLVEPKTVSGDPVLPGFVLPVEKLWEE